MVAFPLQEKLNLRVSYGRVINERHYTGDVFLVGYFVGWARNDLIRSKSLLQMGAIGFEAHLIDASWLNAHASLSYLYSKLSGVRENLDMVGIERTLYAAEKWGVQLGCELSLRMWTKAQVSLNLGVYRLFAPSNTRSFVRDDPLKLEIDAIDYRVGIRYSIKSPKRVKTNT